MGYQMRPPISFFLFLAFVGVMLLLICAPPQEIRIIVTNNYNKTLKHEAFVISALEVEVRIRTDGQKINSVEVQGVRNAANHRYDRIILWTYDKQLVMLLNKSGSGVEHKEMAEYLKEELEEARRTGEAARIYFMFDP